MTPPTYRLAITNKKTPTISGIIMPIRFSCLVLLSHPNLLTNIDVIMINIKEKSNNQIPVSSFIPANKTIIDDIDKSKPKSK